MAHRFFVPQELLLEPETQLPGEIARQISRVLRLRAGEEVVLFAGDGAEHPALLSEVGATVTVRLLPARHPEVELPRALHVAIAVLKGEKPEWTLQKLTELGASRITFLTTERTIVDAGVERWSKRLERYTRIVREASEQSGRVRVPAIQGPETLPQLLANESGPAYFLEPRAERPLPAALQPPPTQVTLLIGPEGGFSPGELHLAQDAGAIAVRLGARVLRAETAAVAAAAITAAALESESCSAPDNSTIATSHS